jgi:hypothetical protein
MRKVGALLLLSSVLVSCGDLSKFTDQTKKIEPVVNKKINLSTLNDGQALKEKYLSAVLKCGFYFATNSELSKKNDLKASFEIDLIKDGLPTKTLKLSFTDKKKVKFEGDYTFTDFRLASGSQIGEDSIGNSVDRVFMFSPSFKLEIEEKLSLNPGKSNEFSSETVDETTLIEKIAFRAANSKDLAGKTYNSLVECAIETEIKELYKDHYKVTRQ